MENSTTKPFYNTEIPSDWDIVYSGQVIKYFGGNAFNSDDSCASGIKWLKIANVGIENTKWDDASFLPKEFINTFKKYLLKEGDVVMALTRPILDNKLKVAQIKEVDIPCLLNQRVAKLITKQDLDIKFAYYLVQMPYFINRMNVSMAGTDPPNLGSGDLEKIKISLAPLPEQRAISHILGLMDSAINQNNQLIAQKELRKKWLMQNLLTGKKRLKGFDGEWKEMKLRKLFNQIKNVNDGGDSHSIMTISSKLGLISQVDKFDRVIAGDSLKKYTQLRKEDFAYNKGNSKTYQMGCIYQLEEKESALVPFVYICFSPTDLVDTKFYKHWFFAHGLDRQLKKIITSGARGDGLLNVNSDDFFNLKVPYPPKEEQTAIAQVLQTADKEIQLLKAKNDKLREQKKGMMQALLTGKVRIKNLNL
jgi:type I restriction enzyme S subunit